MGLLMFRPDFVMYKYMSRRCRKERDTMLSAEAST
jgi:hypothetical protein